VDAPHRLGIVVHNMKIMYLIDVYRDPFAGTEKQLFHLINGLDRARFSPALTLFQPSAYVTQNGFPCQVSILPIRRLYSPASLFRMIAFALTLKKNNYRIVHIFFNDASLIAPVILKAFGIKVIISRRDMGFWYTHAKLAVLRFNRLFIDRVIVNCEAVKQITHLKEKIPLAKIQVIYNGFALESPAPVSQPENTPMPFRKNGTKLVGIVANIRPVKRIDDLVRAFHLLRKQRTDVELVIVGSGDTLPLQKLTQQLDIAGYVHFPGAQTDILPLVRQFDVAVLCSDSEGLSNAIIEYMHVYIPVVCTDTGGNNELIIDGQTGSLVEVGDYKMLAEKLSQVLEDPVRASSMAERAYERITQLCSMEKMLTQHMALYSELGSPRLAQHT